MSETDTEVIPKLCKFVYHRLSEKVPFPKVSCEGIKQGVSSAHILASSGVMVGVCSSLRCNHPAQCRKRGVHHGAHAACSS